MESSVKFEQENLQKIAVAVHVPQITQSYIWSFHVIAARCFEIRAAFYLLVCSKFHVVICSLN